MVVKQRHLGDFFSTCGRDEPAYGAEPIDEYRDLAMLARAWESGLLEANVAEEALARADDAEGKESALR